LNEPLSALLRRGARDSLTRGWTRLQRLARVPVRSRCAVRRFRRPLPFVLRFQSRFRRGLVVLASCLLTETGAARRSSMWFTWSSGATGPFGTCSSPLATFRIGCRSSESAVPVMRSRPFEPLRWDMVRSMCPHPAGTACAGKIRSILRLPGRSPLPSVTLGRVAALRPSRTGPFRTSTGRLAFTFVQVRPTLLTLAPTIPTLTGPCDPAAKPGFLSWGCPKIAPPSYKPRSPAPGRVRRCVSASPRASFGMGKPLPIRVPPAWFLTTSTVCSSSTLRPYFRPLPILGFTAFPSVAKRNSLRCTCCPSKLSLRRQLRLSGTNP
jgi:hypothetical protein